MGHFTNTGLIFKCWIWRVYGQNMVRPWWKYGPHFSSLWYSTIRFPRVFFIFLIFLGLSAGKSATRWCFGLPKQVGFGLEVDLQRLAAVMPEITTAQKLIDLRPGDHWRSMVHGCPVPNGWLMVGSWRCRMVSPCVSQISISIGQMMRHYVTWYAKQTPLFFQKRPSWLGDARDVTRAAFPEERRPAPNLSGLVKEVFGLPLDKTCQVDGHGWPCPWPWAMGWNLGCFSSRSRLHGLNEIMILIIDIIDSPCESI